MPGTTDTVKAMLTPGEFVIRKEAVDMIGVPTLEKLNDMPEAGGHSEIDRLIAQATLKNMTGMYGGGMVNAKQYMGGGMVDMYGGGGKVKEQMMSYEDGGQAMSNLKPVPDNNPGLAKLPKAVRNKMGYMQEGGSVLDMALRRAEPMQLADPEYQMVASYMTKRPREYYDSPRFNEAQEYLMPEYKEFREATGNQFGFPEGLLVDKLNMASQDYGRARGDSMMQRFNPFYAVQQWAERVDPEGEFKEGTMADEVALKKLKRAYSDYIGTADKASVQMGRMVYDANKNQFLRGNFPSAKKRKEQPIKDLNKSADKLTRLIQEIVYNRPIAREAMYDESNPPYIDGGNISNFFKGQREPIDQGSYDSGLMGMMHGGKAKKKKEMYGYQEGGAVQDDAMMQQYLQSLMAQQPQANPFVPFDQRPPSSGEVMSSIPSGMEQGDYYRLLRGELEMENEELVRDKAQNALERIRLDSLLKQAEQDKVDSLLMQGAVEIKSSPGDSFYFPNTPAQDNFMKKYKENMINPTYSPEGS